jgi:8-amino-7-oxononanoate synthase
MTSLDQFAADRIADLAAAGLHRVLHPSERQAAGLVRWAGRDLISFACNDYLNLSQHPAVKQAAIIAIEQYGTGAGASRLVTGNHSLFQQLEERLAAYKGTEAAIVFGSGYLANLGIIPALAEKPDLILADRLVHACILDGAKLSGATLHRFHHNNSAHLQELLARHRGNFRHCLIITETVFSMDGDRAPLAELLALATEFDAWLLTDDAHGLGFPAEKVAVPLQMGTLSKTLGSYGGYLCASQLAVDLLRSRARSFVYSTGLPPASAAAALAALALIEANLDWPRQALAKAALFCTAAGLPAPQSAIVPVIIGEAQAAMAAADRLAAAGYLVTAIRPPTVPPGTARLRFTFTPAHRDEDVRAAAALVTGLRAAA